MKYLLSKSRDDCKIYNIDDMGYGSNITNLSEYQNNTQYSFIKADINDISNIDKLYNIVNIAAETHVDRSIAILDPFMHSNYNGTFKLLEYARRKLVPALLVKAYSNTYGLNGIITRCANKLGPNQFPEKLLLKTIIRILHNMPIFLYGDGNQIREWLYVENHVEAIYQIMLKGRPREVYNISTNNLWKNIDIVEKVRSIVKQKTGREKEIQLTNDRPGHDRRYSLDSKTIRKEIGWKPQIDFSYASHKTVTWYLENNPWWEPLVNSSILHQEPWILDWSKKDNIHA